MSKVAQKAFFAHLYDVSGVLSKVQGALMFFSDDGQITTVEPEDCTFLTVLGECGVAETQKVMDVVLHGGYAAIACGRSN